jgi:hypothetical protein
MGPRRSVRLSRARTGALRRLKQGTILVALSLAALVLSACASEDVEGPSPQPTAPFSPIEATERCTNPEGFEVSHPEGWVTNEESEDGLPPCSLFDPESVDTGDALEVPLDIAVFIRIEPVPFRDVESADFADEISRQELTVGERPAVRLEYQATGGALLPAGTLSTSYRIDLGEETLIAVAHDIGEPAYRVKQDALDAMMRTLEFFEPESD